MRRMVADAEDLFDHSRYSGGGPKLSAKSVVLGAFGQDTGDLLLLLWAQSRPRARSRMAAQRLDASFPRRFHPLAHRPGSHAEGSSYVFLLPTLLLQFPGSEPATLSPVPSPGTNGNAHASYFTKSKGRFRNPRGDQ
jgi:hypothetical protein